MFNRKNTIDKLEANQKELEQSKEEMTSKINLKNNRIGAKVKRLEEIMYKNRVKLDKFKENVDLQLEKNSKLIVAEAEYAENLGKKYSKKK